MVTTADEVRSALAKLADPERAVGSARFFKTGPGQYGEGDVFLGVTVPQTRLVVKRFRDVPLGAVDELLDSETHEHRLAGVLILVAQYPADPDAVFDAYLAAVRRGRVNNWDLVDASSEHIVGPYLAGGDRSLLVELAGSASVWERRVAVLATFAYIKAGDASTTLELAELLVRDPHDLMHKAVGWMLREVGKRVSREQLLGFLDVHAAAMPRTMLSYATEHLTPEERAGYRARRGSGSPAR